MTPDRLLAFSLLALAVIVVPGPSVLFVVGRALSHGRRAALATVLGNALGEYVQVIGVAVGLGAFLSRSDVAFALVKLAGTAYLAYLGVRTIRGRGASVPEFASPGGGSTRGRTVRDGLVVGLTNPKTTVFFAAVLPQFVTTSAGAAPVPLQMLFLGALFMGIALVSDSLWALAGSRARDWFARSPDRLERLHAAGGLVMLGLAARLVLTSRTD